MQAADCVSDSQFLFFALFSIIGKTSSFIGPFVSSAIIDDSGNGNMPFIFLLILGVVSVVILYFVDVGKSRIECRRYLEAEAVRVYGYVEMDKQHGRDTGAETLVVGQPQDIDGMVEVTLGKERAGDDEDMEDRKHK